MLIIVGKLKRPISVNRIITMVCVVYLVTLMMMNDRASELMELLPLLLQRMALIRREKDA